MNDQIICPGCKQVIPLTQALSQQIQEKYQKFYRIRLEEEKAKMEQTLREQLTKKVTQDMELQFRDKANEAEELRRQNKVFQEQLLDLNRLMRQLKNDSEQKNIEMEKRLLEGEEKIRLEEKKRSSEEYRMKLLEKDKKLEDAFRMVEEYKRKLEQGSQQLQGEVLELEIEGILKNEFSADDIRPVPKGIRGADVIQVVKNNYGKICGQIIWELKRTKAWSQEWIMKLKEDQREVKAELAVLISQTLPAGMKNFGLQSGVWIGNFDSIRGLALILRSSLMELASAKNSNINRHNKMEVLYQYFSGLEFKQRLEAVIEAYNSMQEDLEREKRWYSAKWAKEEKNIRKVFDNLSGMYGDLQSMLGKALPDVKGLSMLPASVTEIKDTLF